ncbi:MAG TPA: single-stranded DNA-binding protein [Flavihumibacter sp.]
MSEKNNRVFLIGRLGADPEVKETSTGKKVAHLKLATNESYQNSQGEKVTETQWHSLVAWGKLADKAEAEMVKGTEISVEGKIIYRSYVDREGVKKYVTEISVSGMSVVRQPKTEEA